MSGAAFRAGLDILAEAAPTTPAARLEWVMELALGPTLYDDNDKPTGERGAPLITWEQAAQLLRAEVPS